MDSKLVIEQMAGRWQIKHPDMKPLAMKARRAADQLGTIRWTWIPREKNKAADALANAAMDAQAAGRVWSASTAPVTRSAPAAPATAGGWRAASGHPTTTILLRHGQTPMSVEKRFSGIGDPALTDLGERQAAAAAVRLRNVKDVAAVISSPLTRARDTAERAAGAVGAPLTVDERLIETNFGDWEGLTFSEIRRQWPAEMNAWLADPSVAPPGGESFEQVYHRVAALREDVLSRFEGQTVVLVSHVTPIKTMVRQALKGDSSLMFSLHLDLASLTTLDWYSDGPSVMRTFNDAAHLAGL